MNALEQAQESMLSQKYAMLSFAAYKEIVAENAALKERVAQWAEHSTHMATKENATISDLSKYVSTLEETIAQQAEAIRLKDEALKYINRLDDDLDFLSQADYDVVSNALAIQPSPEILQARDERVAGACANLVNRFISGDGILNDTWVHEIEDEILSGEWRKYL